MCARGCVCHTVCSPRLSGCIMYNGCCQNCIRTIDVYHKKSALDYDLVYLQELIFHVKGPSVEIDLIM